MAHCTMEWYISTSWIMNSMTAWQLAARAKRCMHQRQSVHDMHRCMTKLLEQNVACNIACALHDHMNFMTTSLWAMQPWAHEHMQSHELARMPHGVHERVRTYDSRQHLSEQHQQKHRTNNNNTNSSMESESTDSTAPIRSIQYKQLVINNDSTNN